jgi:ribosomal protein L40E
MNLAVGLVLGIESMSLVECKACGHRNYEKLFKCRKCGTLTRFGTEKQQLRRFALGVALIIAELMLLKNPTKEDHFRKALELERIPSSFTVEHDLELYDYHDYYLFSALSVGRQGHKTLLTFGFLSLVI